ncbi:MAG TPA: hypothetical protein VIF62_02740 [Labilithrix sp.]|jgi:hypothetical protein
MNDVPWIVWVLVFGTILFLIGYADILVRERKVRRNRERHHSP